MAGGDELEEGYRPAPMSLPKPQLNHAQSPRREVFAGERTTTPINEHHVIWPPRTTNLEVIAHSDHETK